VGKTGHRKKRTGHKKKGPQTRTGHEREQKKATKHKVQAKKNKGQATKNKGQATHQRVSSVRYIIQKPKGNAAVCSVKVNTYVHLGGVYDLVPRKTVVMWFVGCSER
jgi:hypothetical protein